MGLRHHIGAREARGRASTLVVDRSPDAVSARLEDAAHYPGGHADAVARPATEAEVAGALLLANRVLPIGVQSSLTGGATPDGGLLLSTERLTHVESIDAEHVRAGAGVPLSQLQDWLTATARWYPPVPTFAGATVGGVVSTNAAGASTFKYGATRAWVDGLTVVLACGCVLDLARGETAADLDDGFEIDCAHGARRFRPATYRMPDVPKCSAGYFAAPGMDLVDLFVGAEGTLGVVTDAVLRVRPEPPALAMALVPVASDADALALVSELRAAAQATWRTRDPHGLDVAAIEYVDRRCLEILREDGVDARQAVALPPSASALLFVHLELAAGSSAERLYAEVAAALAPAAPDTPIVRFCRLLGRAGALDATELAMPGQRRRLEQLLAVREAAPLGVNRRVGNAKRDRDARIHKTAADMIVPFGGFGEMLQVFRDGYARRGLDYAIWGHISDGNVHPNVIPSTYDDVRAGEEAILAFGREVAARGGCPLAEHGVGRSAMKQALLRQLYGNAGLDQMRAIKRALDPDLKLAPGVIFEELSHEDVKT